jgi:asparagine synthase (glutamine-hydrolysing)
MCGIAGILYADRSAIDPSLFERFSGSLRHRGPDDYGFLGWSDGAAPKVTRRPEEVGQSRVGLVHRRLSILDLSEAGWQPMSSPDGRFHIAFNGEIYNYVELRAELEGLGHAFRSHSDTEVLLAAYAEWGAGALNRLIGMFAFAVLDLPARKLFLARDFYGIKPLFYARLPQGIAFASEITPLLDLPGVGRQADPQGVFDYLRYGTTGGGGGTLFAAVSQLPAAHYMEVPLDRPGDAEPVRYWEVRADRNTDLSYKEAADRLRDLFLESVSLHLRSDVPVGACLSGGIDSSAIVMAMRRLQGDKLHLHTFSHVTEDPVLGEERWADLVAGAARATVHKVRPTPEDLVEDLDPLIRTQGEPFGSTSIYAQYRVFRLAQESGIKVMLDGQGADEMLAGYRHFLSARLGSLLRRGRVGQAARFVRHASRLSGAGGLTLPLQSARLLVPPRLQGPFRRLLGKEWVPAWLNADWFEAQGVRSQPVWSPGPKKTLLRDQLHNAFTESSLPMLLRYEDRNSMAFSIESRVPFLTPPLTDFIFSLPEEYVISPEGTTKALFRDAMRGIVPDAVLDRKDKIGFATPERQWLSTLRPWVEETLRGDAAAGIPALDLKAIFGEWTGITEGRQGFDFRIWRWINLIRWADLFAVSFGG